MKTALTEASTSRIEELAGTRQARQRLLRQLDRDDELAATLHGLRLTADACLTVCLFLLLHGLRPAARFAATIGATWLVLAVIGILSRASGRARPERLLLHQLRFLCALEAFFRPLRLLVRAIEDTFCRLIGAPDQPPEEKREEEIMEVVTEGEREGTIEQEAREMIESVIEFRDLDVGRLMTPRTEMISVEDTASLDDAVSLIMEAGHSRLPVFHEDCDHIVGVLHERDALAAVRDDRAAVTVAEIMREALFVPENMRVRGLLAELKSCNTHIAIVLDEYGGTAGVVTFTDVAEEVVGEVREEHDAEEPPEIRPIAPDCFEVSGKMRIDELNETLDLRLPEEKSFDTIGGLAESVAGHVPTRNETLHFQNVKMVVLEADERTVRRLRLELLDEDGDEDEPRSP